MNKYVLCAFLILFGMSPVQGAEPLVLDKLLLRARDHNPEVLAARQAWKVKLTGIRPAGTWPDPTFTYSDERVPSGMAGVDPEKMKNYRIEQMVPFPGKLSYEARMKYHEARIAETAYRDKTIDVLNGVRMRYYQLYLTDEKIALARQAMDVMKAALKSAQARLGSNQTTASDVFMAQTELRKLGNALYQEQQQRSLIAIELNTLLNQPTDAPLGPALPLELMDLPVSLEEFRQLARRHGPMYRTALHEMDHSRAMLARNRLQFAPDFGFMYEYDKAPAGPPGREIGVSVTFPLWIQRPWKQYRGAKEHALETEANSRAMENHVFNQVHTEFIEVNTHLTLARNSLSSLLPLALSALKITQQQYAGGKTDFLRLLEAFRTWIAAHNDYQEEVYHYGEHWALLGRWVGVDVSLAKRALDQMKWMPEEKHE
ncbi:MAG: hypothetical protein A2992_08220 [Elusimicrobia bacterium RIFCSPLOWO2_01_FULL_59_12]|nr:MAG: hypothetical protein A2992_08220 [Elusimicrobia bacterium RIFCSPLOWO2_01_FULL_59_12]